MVWNNHFQKPPPASKTTTADLLTLYPSSPLTGLFGRPVGSCCRCWSLRHKTCCRSTASPQSRRVPRAPWPQVESSLEWTGSKVHEASMDENEDENEDEDDMDDMDDMEWNGMEWNGME